MGIKEFQERIEADKEFAAKFKDAKTPEEVVAIAAKDGFTFTVEDIRNNTELTDAELDSAAGGDSIFAKTYFVTRD